MKKTIPSSSATIKKPKTTKNQNGKLFETYALALEAKDEKELIKIRNEIILHNQPLVTHVINKYFSKNIRSKSTMQDLIQEGCFGLAEAIKRFKPDKGFKFSTYAAWWIRQAVNEALRENESPIIIPPHIINLQNKYITIAQEKGISFEEAVEIDYKSGVLSEKMMFSAIAAINGNKNLYSIDTPSLKEEKNGKKVKNFDSDKNASIQYDAEGDIDKQIMVKIMKNALKNLGTKKRNALLLRFGIIENPIKLTIDNNNK